jgi:hypothetical protein
VAAVALQRGASTEQAANDCESRINNGESRQDDYEHERRRLRTRVIEIQPEKSNSKTKHVAARVVRNYIFRIFDKVGVSTRVELVLYCLQERQYGSSPRSD